MSTLTPRPPEREAFSGTRGDEREPKSQYGEGPDCVFDGGKGARRERNSSCPSESAEPPTGGVPARSIYRWVCPPLLPLWLKSCVARLSPFPVRVLGDACARRNVVSKCPFQYSSTCGLVPGTALPQRCKPPKAHGVPPKSPETTYLGILTPTSGGSLPDRKESTPKRGFTKSPERATVRRALLRGTDATPPFLDPASRGRHPDEKGTKGRHSDVQEPSIFPMTSRLPVAYLLTNSPPLISPRARKSPAEVPVPGPFPSCSSVRPQKKKKRKEGGPSTEREKEANNNKYPRSRPGAALEGGFS
ncbi:hypothetical protein LX36DRAFT_652888 [Colletotrichum falcatum]|nr:hypothetical protein LX36DRAFT_652888 [Colletotrichum falcatum]